MVCVKDTTEERIKKFQSSSLFSLSCITKIYTCKSPMDKPEYIVSNHIDYIILNSRYRYLLEYITRKNIKQKTFQRRSEGKRKTLPSSSRERYHWQKEKDKSMARIHLRIVLIQDQSNHMLHSTDRTLHNQKCALL